MNRNHYIVLFVFLLYINLTNSTLIQNQYDCLYSLFSKFSSIGNFKNGTLDPSKLEFCNTIGINCDANNETVVGRFFLQGGVNILSLNQQLTISDIKCLPTISELSVNGINISDEIVYDKQSNYLALTISNVTGDTFKNGISRPFPPLTTVNINSNYLENTKLKFSLLAEIKNLYIGGGHVILENDLSVINDNLRSMHVKTLNYPDLSSLKKLDNIYFSINENFNTNSISNISTMPALSFLSIETTIPVEFNFNLCPNVWQVSIYGPIVKPKNYIDLTQTKMTTLYFDSTNPEFSIDNNFPVLLANNTNLIMFNSTLHKLPSNLTRGIDGNSYTMIYQSNILNTTLPSFKGTGFAFIYSSNKLTGTIDESWCGTHLSVSINNLEGLIPSCFTCYFKDGQTFANGNVVPMFDRFSNNQFTNYNKSIECTTFAPIVTVDRTNGKNNEIIMSGKDIGFNYKNWLYKNNVMNLTKTNQVGKSYSLNIPGEDLTLLDYIPINFVFPNNQTFYFATKNKQFIINSITPSKNYIDNNLTITIEGSFFSTYKGYTLQSVHIQDINCQLSFEDFFSIICLSNPILTTGTNSNSTTAIKKLTINSGPYVKSVFINVTENTVNNKTCLDDCNGNGDCNIYSGECICYEYQWVGQDCSIPYPYISSVAVPTTKGGISSFSGSFSNVHNGLSITIGGLPCTPITYNSSTTINCTEPIGVGTKLAIITQNGVNASIIYNYYQPNKQCPSNCSNHGVCNQQTGECKCNSLYKGFDCSVLIEIGNGNGTNSTVNENTGGTDMSNQDILFKIYFKSLVEVDFNGNPIVVHTLLDKWNQTKSNNKFKYVLTQKLDNQCEIISTIEEVQTNGKQYSFAGSTFTLDQGSIKFSINIVNYTYQNNLNTLRLDLISSVEEINYQSSECNNQQKNTAIDTNNNSNLLSFNYIKISKNNKVLNGRFINKVVSDGKVTFLSTTIKNDTNSIIVSLNLPHCINECIIDPDFSVLVDMESYTPCNSNDDKRPTWFLPVVVTIPIVCLVIIILLLFIVYKRSTVLKVQIHKLKRIH